MRIGQKRKGVCKDKAVELVTISRLEARMRRDAATLERLKKKHEQKQAAPKHTPSLRKRSRDDPSPATVQVKRTKLDEAEARVVIKYFYKKLLSPPEEDWDGYGRYSAGTPVALSETLRYTWQFHPDPARIVEDVTRWPTTIDLIIQHKGGVVPDALIQHAGCSRTKRKGTRDARSIRPNTEISEVARKRQKELRSQAKDLACA